MVLHWRRCGRAGGCQEQKQIRCREKFIIDTGKDEQQLITANPVSRAVLFMITLVLPVIRGSKGFGFLMTDKTSVREVLTLHLENVVLSVACRHAIKQNILRLMEASFQSRKYLFCNVP